MVETEPMTVLFTQIEPRQICAQTIKQRTPILGVLCLYARFTQFLCAKCPDLL